MADDEGGVAAADGNPPQLGWAVLGPGGVDRLGIATVHVQAPVEGPGAGRRSFFDRRIQLGSVFGQVCCGDGGWGVALACFHGGITADGLGPRSVVALGGLGRFRLLGIGDRRDFRAPVTMGLQGAVVPVLVVKVQLRHEVAGHLEVHSSGQVQHQRQSGEAGHGDAGPLQKGEESSRFAGLGHESHPIRWWRSLMSSAHPLTGARSGSRVARSALPGLVRCRPL